MKKMKQTTSSKSVNPLSIQRKDALINSKFVVEDIPSIYDGQGLVMLSNSYFKKFKLEVDDIVEIVGNRRTYARLIEIPEDLIDPIAEEYLDQKTHTPIQIGYDVRSNAEINIGEKILIRKVTEKVESAKHVVLSSEDFNLEEKGIRLKELKHSLLSRVIKKGDDIWLKTMEKNKKYIYTPPSHPNDENLKIFYTDPKGSDKPVIIDENTVIKIKQIPILNENQIMDEEIYLDNVGGMKKAKNSLRELANIVVNESTFIKQTGIKFTNCILLSGPSGCGKTLLAKAIVNEFPVSYFYINGPEIAGEKPSQAPEDLKNIFKDAEKATPSIILMDEVEALAVNREDLRFDSIMRNIVTQFLHLLETISGKTNVFLIATTNKPEIIDSAFLTQTRFGKEIKIQPPKKDERKEILNIMVNSIDSIDGNNFDLEEVAEHTYGFSGGDLNMLFQTAFIEKLKKLNIYERFVKSKLSYQILRDKVALNTKDMLYVLNKRMVKPSILRKYSIETPKISYDQVGGLKDVKKILKENIQYPMQHPEVYKHYNLTGFRGLLLHGPPGCGKTLIVKALASESSMNFISIKGAEVLNHWLGESEAAVREIFAKAKESAPCIVFFDELDAVATKRGVEGNVHSDRVTAQILTELDGIEDLKDVICIGATNRIDIIDPAIMRPGRLYPVIKIEMPDPEARLEILNIYMKDKPISNEVDIDILVNKTDGFNGAEIEQLCTQAAMNAIRKYLERDEEKRPKKYPPIEMEDFQQAFIKLKEKLQLRTKSELYS
ncbi:MAG: AAA family ATPase [Candidatus Lokiarchaeota archaeon]|nr:AAA family ATPase [Candidatus Lokiarchaeota archaeon]